jgi:hypothetical protein
VDYQAKEDEITQYIADRFNGFAETPITHFLNEFLDLDQYKFDSSLWFSFDGYDYQDLTNQSRMETCELRVFITERNDTEQALHTRLRGHVSAFYAMFEAGQCNFGGIVDMGLIASVRFYDAVEGDKGRKLAEITMNLIKETI